VLTLGPQAGTANNVVQATFTGNAGVPIAFTASALSPSDPAQTQISGVVLDNANVPIQGVTMRLYQPYLAQQGNIPQQVGPAVQTGAQGQFVMTAVPVGRFKLMADGGTAQRPGTWPTLEYDVVTVAGRNNTVGMPIYLLPIDTAHQVCVTSTTGGVLTLPQVPGFSLTLQPGSVTFPGGTQSACVSVTPVHLDKVPMVPAFGQQPRFVVTIQPVGAMFSPPAAVTFPNVDSLKPREVTELFSFDHDLNAFVSIGTGTVSDDGQVVKSDPGVGILKAGWHLTGGPVPPGNGENANVSLAESSNSVFVGDTVTLTANGQPLPGTYTNWTAMQDGTPGNDPSNAVMSGCGSGAACTAAAAFPGLWTPQVTFLAQSGRSATSTGRPVEIKLNLKPTGVGFRDDIDIYKDIPGAADAPLITDPVWRDTNTPDQNDPIAYVRNSTVSTILNFKLISNVSRSITGIILQGDAGICKFRIDNVQLSTGDNTMDFVKCYDAGGVARLPNTTNFYNPITINWSYTLNGRAYSLGASTHKLYVTLSAPLNPSQVYLSVLHLATSNGHASTKDQAGENSWELFGTGDGPTNVRGWNDQPFIYYPSEVPFSGCVTNDIGLKADLLFRTGRFRCGAFAILLRGVIAVNGIECDFIQAKSTDHSLFLVKNWAFPVPTQPDPTYQWLFTIPTPPNEMLPKPAGNKYGDLTNVNGTAGQNSLTPSEKVFADHAFIRYPSGSGRYYDPSYGLTYDDPPSFEAKAIDGFLAPVGPDTYLVRKPIMITNIQFSVLH
jgi:hypothetical protein